MADLHETTQLVRQLGDDDGSAAQRLLPILYDELRSLAGAIFARQPASHTLQPTALLHEAYLKLVDASGLDVTDRAHFFRLAARAMRQVLIDHARSSGAAKRGGPASGRSGRRQLLTNLKAPTSMDRLDWLALDEATTQLAALDERQAAVVELRFFGGMTVDETAAALNVSPRTVELDWHMARAWLSRSLTGE